MILIQRELIHAFFRKRLPDSHKGSHGHALLVAGSPLRMGAAVIAARACLRSGCGLLTIDIPFEERYIFQTSLPEAMLLDRSITAKSYEHFQALGIGPAIGLETGYPLFFHYLIHFPKRMVIDADGITLLSTHHELWSYVKPGTILTPHVKEFDRLFGSHQTMAERFLTAKKEAESRKVILVLKSHQTYITNGNTEYMNTTGNAGLAKGGSGDALCGMITSFLAQGYDSLNSSILACYLHGLAADIAVKQQCEESLLISDVTEHLGKAFRILSCPTQP